MFNKFAKHILLPILLLGSVMSVSQAQSCSTAGASKPVVKKLLECLCKNGVQRSQTVIAGDNNYDILSRPKNGLYRKEPQVIVVAENTKHVQAAVICGSANGLPVVPVSGGHQYEGNSATTGVLVNFAKMKSITAYDGSTGVITFQPGMRFGNLYVSLHELSGGKFGFNGGSCSTVGSGGFLSVGGIGYVSRLNGLGIDSVISFQLVMADGSVKTVSKNQNPDLFWARYSCGAQLGIVTSYTVKTYRVPPKTTSMQIQWAGSEAMLTAVRAFNKWSTGSFPNECTCIFRLRFQQADMTCLCALSKAETNTKFWKPFIDPMGLAKRTIVFYKEGIYMQSVQSLLQTEVANVNSLASIKSDTLKPLDKRNNQVISSRFIMKAMSDGVLKFLVNHFSGSSEKAPIYVAWKTMGGAITKFGNTSFPWRNAYASMVYTTSWSGTKNAEANKKALKEFENKLEGLNLDKTRYCGYTDSAGDFRKRVWGPNLARMQALKKTYDPKGVFKTGMDVLP